MLKRNLTLLLSTLLFGTLLFGTLLFGTLLFGTLLLSSCGSSRVDNSKTEIGMYIQEYQGDEIIEIPMITYDSTQEALADANYKNPEIELINMELEAIYQEIINSPVGAVDEYIPEIRAYPFTGERYLQIVLTQNVSPNYGTDGQLRSYCFDRQENRGASLDEILKELKLSRADVQTAVEGSYQPEEEGFSVGDVNVAGFLLEGETTRLLLEVEIMSSESDPSWTYFYSYIPETGVLENLPEQRIFDPATFALDHNPRPIIRR